MSWLWAGAVYAYAGATLPFAITLRFLPPSPLFAAVVEGFRL